MEIFRVYLDIVLGSSLIIQTLRQNEHPVQNDCYHGPKSTRYSSKSRFPIECQSNWLSIKVICMELIISPLFEAAPLCLGPLWCLLVALHILLIISVRYFLIIIMRRMPTRWILLIRIISLVGLACDRETPFSSSDSGI